MRRVGQVVEQNFDTGVGKRLPDQSHDALVVFEKFMGVINHALAVVLFEQLGINLLFRRLELVSDIVLLADENELTGCGTVFVLEKIMHPEAKIVQIKFAEILARDREWVEIVFLEIAAEFSLSFLVFARSE